MGTPLQHVEALDAADRLEARGRLLQAVDLLQDANRSHPDPAVERRLVSLRHRAFDELVAEPPTTSPAQPAAVAPPRPDDIPTVHAAELTAGALRSGIDTGGCLLVRGLIPPRRVDRLIEDIDRAIAGFEAYVAGAPPSETAPWFEAFKPEGRFRSVKDGLRQTVYGAGGGWTVDSPRALFDLIDTMHETKLLDVVTAFLGERPALTRNKSTLRRVPVTAVHASWHQDGAFLGTPIRTLNVWMALTHCGDDAPGMDILPKRVDRIVETGTEGSIFPWATARDKVLEVADGIPVRRPIFEAGDALLFDELFLHRTACDPAMTTDRYAIETWMFAPSVYPGRQVPLVV